MKYPLGAFKNAASKDNALHANQVYDTCVGKRSPQVPQSAMIGPAVIM